MKAITLLAKDHLELVETEIPVPGENQMLVRTGASTICTSDINDIRGNPFHISLPVGLGHEAAGTVAARPGSPVRDLLRLPHRQRPPVPGHGPFRPEHAGDDGRILPGAGRPG